MRIWLHPPRSLRGRTLLSGSRELSRQRIVRSFFLPQNAQHPPAFAIVKQLNTVDPPLERLFCWGTARFVAAGDLRHVPVGLRPVHHSIFMERLFLKHITGHRHKIIHARQIHDYAAIGGFPGLGKAGLRPK
jgi:hypothetical protein